MKKFMISISLLLLFVFVKADQQLCSCKLPVQKRIVNGEQYKGHIPWQAVVRVDEKVACGGFIATPNWIITSADCILWAGSGQIDVIAGTYNLSTVKSEDIHEASETVVHPLFFRIFRNWGFDIALIRLKKPIELVRGKTEQACLGVHMVDNYLYDELLTVGYGATNRSFVNDDNKLQVGTFSDVPRYTYSNGREYNRLCSSRLICTMVVGYVNGICDGDMGTGALWTRDGKTYVVGVASYSSWFKDTLDNDRPIFCGDIGYYTRLSHVKNFISKHIGLYCY